MEKSLPAFFGRVGSKRSLKDKIYRMMPKDYDKYIKSTKSNISDIKWNNGHVEILFLDAPKRLKDIKSTFIEHYNID